MKKLLLFLFIAILFAVKTKAQPPVVFCPPGAEWRYEYYSLLPYIQKVKYLHDTVMNGETVKVLQCDVFYSKENLFFGCGKKMYIKQHGDTVFMNCCQTNNTWQILYNFAATAGEQWLTTTQDYSATPITHTIMVNATSMVGINGWNLRRLFVTYCYTDPVSGQINCTGGNITERIGYQGLVFGSSASGFLFNYYKRMKYEYTDYDMLFDFMCYQDNDFSPTSFASPNSCYSNVGIEENSLNQINLSVYPNPASQMLNVELEMMNNEAELQITDVLGKVIKHSTLTTQNSQIDVSELEKGIYFIRAGNAVRKFVKE